MPAKDECARSRGVESVLQRHPSDAGVAEILGDDQRGDRDAGHHVSTEPTAVVPGEPADDRYRSLEKPRGFLTLSARRHSDYLRLLPTSVEAIWLGTAIRVAFFAL